MIASTLHECVGRVVRLEDTIRRRWDIWCRWETEGAVGECLARLAQWTLYHTPDAADAAVQVSALGRHVNLITVRVILIDAPSIHTVILPQAIKSRLV